MNKEIFIITHKNIELPQLKDYYPLMVGSVYRDKIDPSFLRDDIGDNISSHNDSYCELTGLYWMWKHAQTDIIGLVHYRRFFAKVKGIHFKEKYIVVNKQNAYQILTSDEIDTILVQTDLIVKKGNKRKRTNKILFQALLGEELMNNLRQVIVEQQPNYMETYDVHMQQHYHINCNMFIGKKTIIDKYCDWLFGILDRVDQMHIDQYGERYKKRELGYLGEILFGVWLEKNKINFSFYDVVNLDGEKVENALMTPLETVKLYGGEFIKWLRLGKHAGYSEN